MEDAGSNPVAGAKFGGNMKTSRLPMSQQIPVWIIFMGIGLLIDIGIIKFICEII